jgi:phosphatidylserine/phosphatidylglycerophosphate/cardiolipin synthase-like enzyme
VIRKFVAVIVGFFMIPWLMFPIGLNAADLTFHNVPAQVYFSPDGGAGQAVIKEIDNAAMEILVQAHSLANPKIANALAGAKKRAVSVEVILDKGEGSGKSASASLLTSLKIPVFIDGSEANTDNKVMLIDKTTVIVGSLDSRMGARRSGAGNLLIIKSKDLAGLYVDNWLKHKQHSRAHQKKDPPKRKS